MPSFSHKAAKEYVDSGGDYCPACGSSDISCGESDWEGELVSQRVVCNDCGCIWYDWFKLYSAQPETAFGDEYASVEKGSFKVEWENLHESEAGEPEYLRFTVYYEVDRDEGQVGWEQVDCASFCTNVPASASYELQLKLANTIMDEVYPLLERGRSIKTVCERLSHINELGEYPKEVYTEDHLTWARQEAAQAWCHEDNSSPENFEKYDTAHKVMDPALAEAFARILVKHTSPKSDFFNAATGFLPDGVPVELPDGSGVMTASWPLPKDHWIYHREEGEPGPLVPNLKHLSDHGARQDARRLLKLAICRVTKDGSQMDFDPDAMVQECIRLLFGSAAAESIKT